MNRLENVEIVSGVLDNVSSMGGTFSAPLISNPSLSLEPHTIVYIGEEYFSGQELLDVVTAIKKLREIYPEHFI